MQRKIITTADGSKTIHIEDWNEHYHSKHGAIQEANHVFIKQGLHFYRQSKDTKSLSEPISILEIGFGTGLNAFITALEAEKNNLNIDYVGVEAYPISDEECEALNYAELISGNHSDVFYKLHNVPWELKQKISNHLSLTKRKQFFSEITDENQYDIIYFDAFAARVQPELWDEAMFKIMHRALKNQGILVTYSAKGSVKRAMLAAGLIIERLEGPPGKRHMLRATKGNINE